MFNYLFAIVLKLTLIVYVVSKDSYHKRIPCGLSESYLYKESEESHRMIEIVFLGNRIIDCFIYGNKLLAENSISKKICKPKDVFVEKNVLSEKALLCSEWLLNRMRSGEIPSYSDPDFPQEFNNKIDRNFVEGLMIFPGTKWCGAGNSAENYDDLGKEKETDKCCRTHDHCQDYILSRETKYNLTNIGYLPKVTCGCDNKLSHCFKGVNKWFSKKIGRLYFNVIQNQCFKKDYPIVNCLEYKGIPLFWQSCQKYVLDYNQKRIYQFFDAIYFE